MTSIPASKSHPSFRLARLAAQAADEKLGRDIVVLDVRNQSSVADCFVFVSATSHLHVRSLEDAIRESMRASGASLLRTDGQRGHVWRALDYGNVLIHIMDEKTRDYYSVERLWDQGKKVAVSPAKTGKPKKKAPLAKTKRRKSKKKS